MNKKQIEFMEKFIEYELISVSDAFDYETFDIEIERKDIRKAMEETLKLIKKHNKKPLKRKE